MSYHQRYQDIVIPEAYERLLLDTWTPSLFSVSLILKVVVLTSDALFLICRYFFSLKLTASACSSTREMFDRSITRNVVLKWTRASACAVFVGTNSISSEGMNCGYFKTSSHTSSSLNFVLKISDLPIHRKYGLKYRIWLILSLLSWFFWSVSKFVVNIVDQSYNWL